MEKKQRFSLRKFKLGVASVLVGLAFATGVGAVQVSAADEAKTEDTADIAISPADSSKLTDAVPTIYELPKEEVRNDAAGPKEGPRAELPKEDVGVPTIYKEEPKDGTTEKDPRKEAEDYYNTFYVEKYHNHEVLKYTTNYIADENLEYGKREVKRKGEDGYKEEQGEIWTLADGKPAGGNSIATAKSPIAEIIAVGTKPTVEERRIGVPQIIIEDKVLTKPRYAIKEEGEVRVIETKTTYTVDEKTGEVTEHKGEPVVIQEGKPRVLVIGTAEVVDGKEVREPSVPDVPKEAVRIGEIGKHRTIYVADENLEYGKREVRQKGRNSLMGAPIIRRYYDQNGLLMGGSSAQELLIMGADEIIAVGTKPTVEVEKTHLVPLIIEDWNRTILDDIIVEEEGRIGTKTVTTTYTVDEKTGEVTEHKGEPVIVEPIQRVERYGKAVPTVAPPEPILALPLRYDDAAPRYNLEPRYDEAPVPVAEPTPIGYYVDDNIAVNQPTTNLTTLTGRYGEREIAVRFDNAGINASKLEVRELTDEEYAAVKIAVHAQLTQFTVWEAFDLHLADDNGQEIKANGVNRVVTLAVVKGEDEEISVYYYNPNGQLEKVESTYVNGVLSFTTNHFSTYVVVKTKVANSTSQNANAGGKNLPNTSAGALGATGAFGLAAAIIAKRRKENK